MADHITFAAFHGENLPRALFEPNDADIIDNPHPIWGICHGELCLT
jgi:hypothetical protein